jgi:hypothetical protein
MYSRAIITIALLMLVAIATAQQTTEILDIKKVEEAGKGSAYKAKVIALAFNYLALGLMLGATIYILVVRKRSLPELFGEWWFWVPIVLNIVPVILYSLSDFSPLFRALYNSVKEDLCPFLFCP